MAEFTKVAAVSEIPSGSMKGFMVNGEKLLVANINGNFYAMGSICTHRGGPLEEGELSGNTLTCPWHGAQFDVTTGTPTMPPAQMPVKKFEVKVENNDVFVKV